MIKVIVIASAGGLITALLMNVTQSDFFKAASWMSV